MKPIVNIFILFSICFAFTIVGAAGSNLEVPAVPEVGQPCPNFTLTEVVHFKKKKVFLADFKGKWTFLDFWGTTCTVCIASFKKINKIQEEFKDHVEFMLIGRTNFAHNANIRELFDKLTLRQGLNLPCAFDSTVFNDWDIHAVPHIVVLDPNGIVRFITDGRDLTSEKVRALINGQEIKLYQPGSISKVFSANEIVPESKVLCKSTLTEWNGERQGSYESIDRWLLNGEEVKKAGWLMTMTPLSRIYKLAFVGRSIWFPSDTTLYGKFYRDPLLEMQDTSRFQFDETNNVGNGGYNYHLLLPIANLTKENIMNAMQADLTRGLGYEATIEKRKMPVWRLVALSEEGRKRLQTKGGESFDSSKRNGWENSSAGFTIRNQPIDRLTWMLGGYLSSKDPSPYLNGTGLTGAVDFTIEADMLDMVSIRRALQKQGLDFEKGTKEMNVIVIREGKASLN